MVYLILLAFIFILPRVWLSSSLKRNNETLVNMPFNGLQFGELLLKENNLENVSITETDAVDHYDLENREVRVLEDRLNRKSITSIAVICHEIGHAIQDKENYTPLKWRSTLIKKSSTFSTLFAFAPIDFEKLTKSGVTISVPTTLLG